MRVEILQQPFDPWEALRAHEQARGPIPGAGAAAIFVGTMRELNEGDKVHRMLLEHYPGMTEKHLERTCAEAARKWDLMDMLVIHRVGGLEPTDPIVLVAVWSAHRRDAFEASRFIMEDLKARAPFWKKEQLDSGSRWVEKNTPGY